jgi:hypothetical protein
MSLASLAYPDTVVIGSQSFQASRDIPKRTVTVPYDVMPDIEPGATMEYATGGKAFRFRVIDFSSQPLGHTRSLVGKSNLLTIHYENETSAKFAAPPSAPGITIQAVNGQNIQIGTANSMTVTMHIHELVEKVAVSGDIDAKGKLIGFLENKTVAAILGAGTSALIAALTAGG